MWFVCLKRRNARRSRHAEQFDMNLDQIWAICRSNIKVWDLKRDCRLKYISLMLGFCVGSWNLMTNVFFILYVGTQNYVCSNLIIRFVNIYGFCLSITCTSLMLIRYNSNLIYNFIILILTKPNVTPAVHNLQANFLHFRLLMSVGNLTKKLCVSNYGKKMRTQFSKNDHLI